MREMNVTLKEQFMKGYTLYDNSESQKPRKIFSHGDSEMFRISGGTMKIVESLYSRIESSKVLLSEVVERVVRTRSGVQVVTAGRVE